ncbi:MAG: LacI family DNA-binding transcriptional regulator [Opitutaceae bacterium]|nr:LacI family DNA-binding transcriptional regulator [Opitutaceae bacterium]
MHKDSNPTPAAHKVVVKPRALNRSITVKDIAAEAGVSITTVSNVLLGKSDTYAPETGVKVKEVAQRMGYRRNNLARSLVRQKSMTLGILMEASFNFSHAENQYFVGFLQGFLSEASRRGYQLKITVQDNHLSDDVIAMIDDRSIDGLVALVISPDNALMPWFDNARLPVVLVGCEARSPKASSVDVDDYECMSDLLDQVWQIGHRRYALLTGEQEHSSLAERERAFAERIAQRRDPALTTQVFKTNMEGLSVDSVLREIAALPASTRPTVLVCINDLIAVSVIRKAGDYGLRVPEDISVTGFDGFAVGDWCQPQLATIRQPLARIGSKAAEILVESIDAKDAANIHHAVLPGRVLMRESVKVPTA